MFTDDNPDKGTETEMLSADMEELELHSLQMITPTRGRKPEIFWVFIYTRLVEFTDDNPDKGTETFEVTYNGCTKEM